MLDKETFIGGLDLKFFEDPDFESVDYIAPNAQAPVIARNALRFLTMGWPAKSWTQLLSWPVFKAVFIRRDPDLLKEFRFAFQEGFLNLFKQLDGKTLTKEQSEQVQLYISNCLSLLPYSDLTPYESIKIPQDVNGTWTLVEYYVNPIELTDEKNSKIRDYDRVFAYGLEPLNNDLAKPHLIFMGTTYPAGQGFMPQIYTDFEAFDTVGSSLYLGGRAKLENWLASQKDKVHVCGVSLGGSLSLLLAIDLGNYLSRVDALNPPGLHEPFQKNDFDHWDELSSRPQVVVQQQANDPVSLLGAWKHDWEILRVIPPKDKQGPNPFLDHFLNYAGFAETQFTYATAKDENLKRKFRNFWIYGIGRTLIHYLAIVPFSYIVRPIVTFLLNKRSLIAYGISGGISLIILTGLATGGVLPLFFFASIMLVATLSSAILFLPAVIKYFVQKFDPLPSDDDNEMENFAALHDPSLPRNPSMDIYNPDNAMETELTFKELNTYYKAMRCLVKQKEFVPDTEISVSKFKGLSKKEVTSQ